MVGGIEDGVSLAFENDGELTALAVARLDAAAKTLRLLDVRVDYDFRRQGIGSALAYALIAAARDSGLRAVAAETPANNFPAAQYLLKVGFELTGFDTHLRSNHDLVKESVALFWYIPLD